VHDVAHDPGHEQPAVVVDSGTDGLYLGQDAAAPLADLLDDGTTLDQVGSPAPALHGFSSQLAADADEKRIA